MTAYRIRFIQERIGVHTDVPELSIGPEEDFEETLRDYIAQHLTAADADQVELEGHRDAVMRSAWVRFGEEPRERDMVASFVTTAIPADSTTT